MNVGSADGVYLGQRVLVFGTGDEIQDPDSGASLGVLELVKGRGAVIHVQENLSTVEAERKQEIFRQQPSPFAITLLAQPDKIVEVAGKFRDASLGDSARLF